MHNIRTVLDAGLSAENIGALTAVALYEQPDSRNNSTSGGNNVAAVTTTW